MVTSVPSKSAESTSQTNPSTKPLPTKKTFTKKPLRKVQVIAMSYYSRKEIQQAMFEFCKNRETIANHNQEFFAKRPDTFDYPSDIFNSAKQGATSFHCSEEIWEDPMKIKTEMTPKQYNEIRTGWDFLIDIDSKYLDYSKIAARILLKTLKQHGVENVGLKYSGSKGFHLIIPFKAFPETVGENQTKDMFPAWPRAIAQYLFKTIKDPMNQEIIKISSREKLEEEGELKSEHICPNCKTPIVTKKIGVYECTDLRCKSRVESMKSNRKEMLCPSCNGKMKRVEQKEIQFCETCKINTSKIKATGSNLRFKEEITTKSAENSVDLVLVSSRHLFRAPYSLHEKTSLVSLPISKEELEDFQPTNADPLKIKEIRNFMPDPNPGEAKYLLSVSLEEAKENEPATPTKKFSGESIDLKGLTITEDMFPPVIKKILQGIKDDGRKRALSLLLSFYSSLEFPKEYMKEKLNEWNEKNYLPLKQGYIKAQIDWYSKNKRLPPNYDKPIYKEFGINSPPEPGMKNPINYTIKKAMQAKGKEKK